MDNKRPCPSRGMYRRFRCNATAIGIEVLRSLGTEFSDRTANLLERGDGPSVVSQSVNPADYDCPVAFRDDYLAAELFSKFPNFDLGIDTASVAIAKFHESEACCLEANNRLKSLYGVASTTTSVPSILYAARRKIERLLGPFSWDRAEQFFGFGPGASTRLKRSHGDAFFKFGAKPHTTRECAVLAYTAVRRVPGWFSYLATLSDKDPETVSVQEFISSCFEIVEGNRITTVPKNAKTDRCIAIEPDLNMFVQKGIGGVIRRLLKRVGVDLDDQSINQRAAREGSLYGDLATLDLSAASDSISIELVKQLMPDDWWSAIELCRSHRGVLPDGTVLRYQKVSSMGNGFTFELESLLFWALSRVCVDITVGERGRVHVYGDDIIVPVDACALLIETLRVCGFSTNAKKSFWSGPFRESCGKHYFRGHDVTPFYVRESVESPDRLIWFANRIREWSRNRYPYGLDGRLQAVYLSVVKKLPSFWQTPRVSYSHGDVALFGDFDEVLPRRAPNGCEGWIGVGVATRSFENQPDDYRLLLKALLRIEGSRRSVSVLKKDGGADSRLGVPLPKRKISWKVVRPSIPQWENFGPWL